MTVTKRGMKLAKCFSLEFEVSKKGATSWRYVNADGDLDYLDITTSPSGSVLKEHAKKGTTSWHYSNAPLDDTPGFAQVLDIAASIIGHDPTLRMYSWVVASPRDALFVFTVANEDTILRV